MITEVTKMPKGFNQKAIEGFSQWMEAILAESGLQMSQVATSTEKTKTLLAKGFPQVRKY